jgi:hypothetical protein
MIGLSFVTKKAMIGLSENDHFMGNMMFVQHPSDLEAVCLRDTGIFLSEEKKKRTFYIGELFDER